MKYSILIFLFLCVVAGSVKGQVSLSTEYFSSTPFRNEYNNKIGDAKGSAVVYQGAASIPFSTKMDQNNRPTLWGMSLYGSYTRMNNSGISRQFSPEEILNLSLNFIHIRPFREKYSIMAIVGAGMYTPHADFSRVSMRQILGTAGGVFIWHLRNNIDIGAGLAINNSFGYPMLFPAMVFQWKLEGKYEVQVQLMNAIELSAGIEINKYLKLFLTANMDAAMALEKQEGKNMVFTHQYVNVALQPVIQLGKGFTIPLRLGVTPYRSAYYMERTLKAFFKNDDDDFEPHFSLSFYGSIALRYGF